MRSYHLTLIRRGSTERFTMEKVGAAVASDLIESDADRLQFLVVEEEGGGGDFILWLQGGRACIRLDEHREHYATERVLTESLASVRFTDDDGSAFEIPHQETVPRSEAFRALTHWLMTGKRLPDLAWS